MTDLSTIKAKDFVLIRNRYGYRKARVEKVGKLHIVLENGEKYRANSGYKVGQTGYDLDSLEVWNEEIWVEQLQKNIRANRIRFIQDVKWDDISSGVIGEIYKLVKPDAVSQA